MQRRNTAARMALRRSRGPTLRALRVQPSKAPRMQPTPWATLATGTHSFSSKQCRGRTTPTINWTVWLIDGIAETGVAAAEHPEHAEQAIDDARQPDAAVENGEFGRHRACRQQRVDAERGAVAEPLLDQRAERPKQVQIEDQVEEPGVEQGRRQQPPGLVQTVAARCSRTRGRCSVRPTIAAWPGLPAPRHLWSSDSAGTRQATAAVASILPFKVARQCGQELFYVKSGRERYFCPLFRPNSDSPRLGLVQMSSPFVGRFRFGHTVLLYMRLSPPGLLTQSSQPFSFQPVFKLGQVEAIAAGVAFEDFRAVTQYVPDAPILRNEDGGVG